jgi:enolase-phosphatase E1
MTAAPRLYLLDVEGTVAPIAFVYERLFPFARAHLRSFLDQHGEVSDVQADLRLLAEESRSESDKECPMRGVEITNMEQAAGYLLWLMDRDRKSTALKSLQGKIWKSGFESGELKGELFVDVPAVLERRSKSARIAIYSSGSIEAQRLIFRYSTYGDLTPHISAYFDTRTGPKVSRASYEAIAAAMHVAPEEAIFFSDVLRELDPAREAGFDTRLVVREGNARVEDAQGHLRIDSFDGV